MKPIKWDAGRAQKELRHRLEDAKKLRERMEPQWRRNEETLMNFDGGAEIEAIGYSIDSPLDLRSENLSTSDLTVGVNYTFKNYRFLHAQLSANPPRVKALPTTSDPTDRQKAEAADKIVTNAARVEQMQEKIDRMSGKTLLYGTGWMKTIFDPNTGDIVDRDEETGEFELEGAIDVSSPSTWNVYIDPQASTWDEVRYVYERYEMPYEEALMLFGEDKEEVLKESIRNSSGRRRSQRKDDYHEEVVEVYEYWEKGLPVNGMIGRYCWCLEDGTPLTKVKENPFNFSPPLERGETEEDRLPPTAYLPYHIFTDIDVPDEVYGMSFINYEAPIQDILNRIDTATLDAIAAHGVCRLVLPETAEVMEESIMNTNYDFIRVTGNQGPHFVSPPSLMPETHQMRDRLKAGGDDMAGVNEAMFGQQSREQSGFSMQYATNQGNMIRRRLYNKYQLVVESIYRGYLNLARKHWTDYRLVQTLGAEGAFESIPFRGVDIDGGFDLHVQYGGFSLDPDTRREQIMQLKPMFQEAGMDVKTILSMMNITDLDQLYDIMELSPTRQQEIFQEMIDNDVYIAPRELQEHKGMLQYAYRYVMTAEFNLLPEPKKLAIEKHIKDREALASAPAQVPGAPGMAPGGPGGAPPAPGLGAITPEGAPPAVGMTTPPVQQVPGTMGQ